MGTAFRPSPGSFRVYEVWLLRNRKASPSIGLRAISPPNSIQPFENKKALASSGGLYGLTVQYESNYLMLNAF
jgi:hypothetical protein